MISLVINTCAGGAKAAETLSSGRQPHAQRAYALRNFILPAALADPTFDEVIVVGEWEPGSGYVYIEVPSVHFSCADALAQRQAGFERSTGDWVVFQHDDHMLVNELFGHDDFGDVCSDIINATFHHAPYDILVPSRYTRLRDVNGERLYNGETSSDRHVVVMGPGYISGHCAIYRREVLEACPWGNVDTVHTWDIAHTKQIRAAGFKIEWSNALRCYDIEAEGRPWA
jgi:hypothetical protein